MTDNLAGQATPPTQPNPLQEVFPNIYRFEDSCVVYCIKRGEEAILIESGRGDILNYLAGIGVKQVSWVLHTHYHRDMNQGDLRLIETGAKIAVPESAVNLFADAEGYWKKTPTYSMFMYGDKYEVSLRNIPVAKSFQDGDLLEWNGITLRALATPGHTDHHIAYVLEDDNNKLVFSGDIIHSPGRVWELDSIFSQYEEIVQVWSDVKMVPKLQSSIELVRKEQPTLLLPAHGEVMTDCDQALQALQDNIAELLKVMRRGEYFNTPLETVPGVQVVQTCCTQYVIEGTDGHAIMIDAGFVDWPNYQNLIEWFQQHPTLKKVDAIIPTHYHADHVASIVGFIDHYDSEVYVLDLWADVLEEPHRYSLPCLSYRPIPVTRRFSDGESFQWQDWTFTIHFFPGQTYWHQAIEACKGDLKILFVGDALDNYDNIRCVDPFNYCPISETEGAAKVVEVMAKVQPQYIATGHQGLRQWDVKYLEPMQEYVRKRNAILRKLIAQTDANMGYDIHWTRLDPFHSTHVKAGDQLQLTARVRNHLPEQAQVKLALTVPSTWSVSPAVQEGVVNAKTDTGFEFLVQLPAELENRRYWVGCDVELAGTAYGEMGMAEIDVGGDYAPILGNKVLYVDVDPEYGFFK